MNPQLNQGIRKGVQKLIKAHQEVHPKRRLTHIILELELNTFEHPYDIRILEIYEEKKE